MYDEDNDIYEYNYGDIIPEMVICCDFSCFKVGSTFNINGNQTTYINFFELFFVGLGLVGNEPSEMDIIYNIYPKLVEKGIQILFVEDPNYEFNAQKNSYAKKVMAQRKSFRDYNNSPDQKSLYDNKDYQEIFKYGNDILKVINDLQNHLMSYEYGYPDNANQQSEFVNIYNAERYTKGNHRIYGNPNIWMFGPCAMFGTMVKDEHTIASYLQEKVGVGYNVRNRGNLYFWINYSIRSCEFHVGDILVIMVNNIKLFKRANIPVYSVLDAYSELDLLEENVWENLLHCNWIVTQLLANRIYQLLKERKYLVKRDIDIEEVSFINQAMTEYMPKELFNWMNTYKPEKTFINKDIGAIVMNCNPFTLGHKYLIQEAVQQVDWLYIFVVEENKSFFSFNDRIRLVREGVKDLTNVTVLPSGSFMISAITLPGYFHKDEVQTVEIDMTEDIEIFGKWIAPAFNINKRFAGEEPIDIFTLQYNRTMKEVLPQFNIQFIEIVRRKVNGEYISASRVRKLLQEHNIEEIKKLVPVTTYEYLRSKYF